MGAMADLADQNARNMHILEGQLDYDVQYGETNDQKFAEADDMPIIEIKMVYPTRAFGEDNTEFKKRHESMQADADEHYKLLVDLQAADIDFDRLLHQNHKRKNKVEKILKESRNW